RPPQLAGRGAREVHVPVAAVEPDLVGAPDVGDQPLPVVVAGIDDDGARVAGADQAVVRHEREPGGSVQAGWSRQDGDPLALAVVGPRLEDVDLTWGDHVPAGVRNTRNRLVEEAG